MTMTLTEYNTLVKQLDQSIVDADHAWQRATNTTRRSDFVLDFPDSALLEEYQAAESETLRLYRILDNATIERDI